MDKRSSESAALKGVVKRRARGSVFEDLVSEDLTDPEIVEFGEILDALPNEMVLKILQRLPERWLKVMCERSWRFAELCREYRMHERWHRNEIFMLDKQSWIQQSVAEDSPRRFPVEPIQQAMCLDVPGATLESMYVLTESGKISHWNRLKSAWRPWTWRGNVVLQGDTAGIVVKMAPAYKYARDDAPACVGLTNAGHVVWWYVGADVATRVLLLEGDENEEVVDVQCRTVPRPTVALLTASGQLYQLTVRPPLTEVQRVVVPDPTPVFVQVAAREHEFWALERNTGLLYSWHDADVPPTVLRSHSYNNIAIFSGSNYFVARFQDGSWRAHFGPETPHTVQMMTKVNLRGLILLPGVNVVHFGDNDDEETDNRVEVHPREGDVARVPGEVRTMTVVGRKVCCVTEATRGFRTIFAPLPN